MKKLIKIFILLVILAFIAVFFCFRLSQNVNILVIGTDNSDKYTRHADTIILVNFKVKENKINLVSIPRDTLVEYKGKKLKINSIYVSNYPKGGHKRASQETAKEAGRIIGADIPYYLQVDYEGVEKIVDFIGGIKVNIEKEMKYQDKKAGLYINFKPGLYTLKGKDAVKYLRFRKDEKADIGRIERQQKFLYSLIEAGKKKLTKDKISEGYKTIYKSINTNVPLDKVVFLFEKYKNYEVYKIYKCILPGKAENIGKSAYWVPDYREIKELEEKLN